MYRAGQTLPVSLRRICGDCDFQPLLLTPLILLAFRTGTAGPSSSAVERESEARNGAARATLVFRPFQQQIQRPHKERQPTR
jgi:hypothetical protein